MSSNNALTVLSDDIYAMREQFGLRLVNNSLNFEAEAGFAIQQLAKAEFTMKIAMANRQSVVDAVVNVAAIGISLNPAKKQAYLVPRDNRICLDISYMGLLDLAIESGSILWGQAKLVHEADHFELSGLDRPPQHTYKPFSKDRGPVVGVYVTVKTRDGDYLTDTMTYEEALAIRDRSSAWKASKSGPWKTDEGEMVKKTVIKRAYKLWPKCDRLDEAIHHLNTNNGEGLEILDEPAPKLMPKATIAAVPDIALRNDRKQVIDAVASSLLDHFNADDLVGAYEEYIGVTDDDEKLVLWKLLPSNVRSAIKKHGESLKAPAAAEQPAAA